MGIRLWFAACGLATLVFAGCPTVDLGDTPSDIGQCNPPGGEDYSDVFTTQEAKIRETYDALLGHLERFEHLIHLGLVHQK